MPNKVKILWTEVKQKLFEKIEQNVACNILLACPDFD